MKVPIIGTSLLFLTTTAHALINIGPGELSLTTALSGTYNSNVSGGSNGAEDFYLTLNPRLDFVRNAGLIELQSDFGVNITRYSDQTQLNSEDLNGSLELKLAEIEGSTFQGSLRAAYAETATVYSEINSRVHSDTLSFDASGQLKIGRRLSLNSGVAYSTARRDLGSSSDTLGATAQLSLADFLRDTAARASYAYRYARSDSGQLSANTTGATGAATPSPDINQTSHQFTAGLSRPLIRNSETSIYADFGYQFLERSAAEKRAGAVGGGGTVFNTGIDGPFLPRKTFPKLKSKLGLSYSKSATPGLNDTGSRSFQGNMSLTWDARDRTKIGVTASKTRTLTINNLTADSTSTGLNLSQELRYNLSATATGSYSWVNYPVSPTLATTGPARDDNILALGSGLNYSFARVWKSGVSYNYRDVSSSTAGADFVQHLVTVTVSCRY